jgi:predicted permease
MLLDRIQTIPGVLAVAGTTVVPMSGTSWSNKTWMEGSTQNQGVDSMLSHISSGYFRTLDVPLLAGRDFNGQDTRNSPKVAVVSEAFVRRLTKSPNPIGESFHVEATPSQPETVYRIVGVVGDAKYRSLREDFRPAFYTSLSQDPDPTSGNKLLIRSNLPVEQLIPFVRRSITEIDPQARFTFRQFRMQIEESLQPERLMASLSSAFGVLAGLLSAIGLYGVISYLVTRRRNEIGIRMALGADRWQIFVMVLRESCALLVTGLAVGTVLSVAAAHSAQAFLFELKPYDGVTLITAVALLAALGVIATYIPARRAAGLAPLDALREE